MSKLMKPRIKLKRKWLEIWTKIRIIYPLKVENVEEIMEIKKEIRWEVAETVDESKEEVAETMEKN